VTTVCQQIKFMLHFLGPGRGTPIKHLLCHSLVRPVRYAIAIAQQSLIILFVECSLKSN